MDGNTMGSVDWPTTNKSLDALRDEFVKAHTLSEDKVENAIVQALSVNAGYKYKSNKNPVTKQPNSELWIEGIQKFQNKTGNYSDYGFIKKGDSTYNLLKCEVAKNLKITLNSPPFECSSTPTP
jgi:hypothetical protein